MIWIVLMMLKRQAWRSVPPPQNSADKCDQLGANCSPANRTAKEHSLD